MHANCGPDVVVVDEDEDVVVDAMQTGAAPDPDTTSCLSHSHTCDSIHIACMDGHVMAFLQHWLCHVMSSCPTTTGHSTTELSSVVVGGEVTWRDMTLDWVVQGRLRLVKPGPPRFVLTFRGL